MGTEHTHDAEADLAVSLGIAVLGIAVYLVLSGNLVAWVGLGLAVVILLLWPLHSRQLTWPFSMRCRTPF